MNAAPEAMWVRKLSCPMDGPKKDMKYACVSLITNSAQGLSAEHPNDEEISRIASDVAGSTARIFAETVDKLHYYSRIEK